MSSDNFTGSGGIQNSPASELQNKASQDFGQVTDKAKEDLDAVTHKAAADARELGEQAKSKIGEVTDQAKEKLGEVTDQAKSFATDQKTLAASQINGVASAITRVAEELEGDNQTIARYARDLANGLNSVGKTVEERNVDDLMGMAQDFGRKQPVAFLGAAALAGFVASRFALASAHRRDTKAPATSETASPGSSTYTGTSYDRTGGL